MGHYNVALLDRQGFTICEDAVEGLKAAKARAKYLLTDDHARYIETDHATLGTDRAEVRDSHGECVFDAFRKGN